MRLAVFGLILIWATCHTQASDPGLDKEWSEYKAKHNKVYSSSEEESKRRNIWEERLAEIKAHNANRDKGMSRYTLGQNRFSDWTLEEFKKLGGSKPSPKELAKLAYQSTYGSSSTNRTKPLRQGLPASFDWRDRGAVTPVRDQGQCNSCWSFATTGAMEAAHFLQTGQLVVLSTENFIDCVDDGGPRPDRCSIGCFCEAAMRWASGTAGIATEAAYPLVSVFDSVPAQSAPCRDVSNDQLKVRVIDAVMLPSGSEDALKEAIATVGPVTVLVNQDAPSIMGYSGGILDDPTCANSISALSHAVLAVGYGTDGSGTDYWIIKNSYGADWGEQGYIRLRRGVNQCGVGLWNWYPTVG